MNLRTFAVFIIIVGLIVAAYGGYKLYQVETAFQKDMDYARSGKFLAHLYTSTFKDRAAKARKEPTKILGVGGLIVIIGIGIAVAAKKKPDKEPSVEPSEPKSPPPFPPGL